MRVVPNGLPCGCGANGCIEQYGSGRALQRYANTLADAGGIGQALADVRSKNGNYLHGKDIGDLVDVDDPGALQALRQLGDWLGQACASFAAILDPQVFVFGGGVASAGEKLLQPIRQAFLQTLPARGYHPEPEFRIAQLVNDAGVVGAADVARQHAAATAK
jgi:glucokinase